MPTITIDGKECEFEKGRMILQVAKANGIEIPHYCYHDGLSITASCRICLVEVWAPNPRADNKLEPIPKLLPACQTPAGDGQVVYSTSPKAIRNQKQVMELLLINHPLDCPVCDQAGECFLQDYSYEYGRGASRYEETKVKQPKKDLGPHVLLYSDRCIMCTRCVRVTHEITGTKELMITGRGNDEQIDIFTGVALDNELSGCVVDVCPVGAMLDKDFLFKQRVWRLTSTPSIDPITASGDNIWIEHNEGTIHRVRPRENMAVNQWWMTDEVRYGWKFVHSDRRLRTPMHRMDGQLTECAFTRAVADAARGIRAAVDGGGRLGMLISPMLPCEEAYALAQAGRAFDELVNLGLGPVPMRGEDRIYPLGMAEDDPKAFKVYAEKAPNARGVRRVLDAIAGEGNAVDADGFLERLRGGAASGRIGAVVLTGNYPGEWATSGLLDALRRGREAGLFVVVIDTLESSLLELADVVLPGATFAEKAGTYENARGMLQSFMKAIDVVEGATAEGEIATALAGGATGDEFPAFDAAAVRQGMAEVYEPLGVFATDVREPNLPICHAEYAMEMVEL